MRYSNTCGISRLKGKKTSTFPFLHDPFLSCLGAFVSPGCFTIDAWQHPSRFTCFYISGHMFFKLVHTVFGMYLLIQTRRISWAFHPSSGRNKSLILPRHNYAYWWKCHTRVSNLMVYDMPRAQMACADFVHNTHIATHSFTYNADSSSAIFRFMNTFVRLIEALDGFSPNLCGEYWQGCQTLMNPGVGCWNTVSERAREKDHQRGQLLSAGEREREECVFYSLLEATAAQLRQSLCLDWRLKQSPWLKSMLDFTKPRSRKQNRTR